MSIKELNRPIFRIDKDKAKEIATVVYEEFKVNFDDARISLNSIIYLVESCEIEDGYGLAKKLEDITSCDINTMIVEELDTISYRIEKAEKELNNQWIKDNNIKPLFKQGEEVIFNEKNTIIYEVREKEGKYLIPTENENSYWVVDFEKITGIQE